MGQCCLSAADSAPPPRSPQPAARSAQPVERQPAAGTAPRRVDSSFDDPTTATASNSSGTPTPGATLVLPSLSVLGSSPAGSGAPATALATTNSASAGAEAQAPPLPSTVRAPAAAPTAASASAAAAAASACAGGESEAFERCRAAIDANRPHLLVDCVQMVQREDRFRLLSACPTVADPSELSEFGNIGQQQPLMVSLLRYAVNRNAALCVAQLLIQGADPYEGVPRRVWGPTLAARVRRDGDALTAPDVQFLPPVLAFLGLGPRGSPSLARDAKHSIVSEAQRIVAGSSGHPTAPDHGAAATAAAVPAASSPSSTRESVARLVSAALSARERSPTGPASLLGRAAELGHFLCFVTLARSMPGSVLFSVLAGVEFTAHLQALRHSCITMPRDIAVTGEGSRACDTLRMTPPLLQRPGAANGDGGGGSATATPLASLPDSHIVPPAMKPHTYMTDASVQRGLRARRDALAALDDIFARLRASLSPSISTLSGTADTPRGGSVGQHPDENWHRGAPPAQRETSPGEGRSTPILAPDPLRTPGGRRRRRDNEHGFESMMPCPGDELVRVFLAHPDVFFWMLPTDVERAFALRGLVGERNNHLNQLRERARRLQAAAAAAPPTPSAASADEAPPQPPPAVQLTAAEPMRRTSVGSGHHANAGAAASTAPSDPAAIAAATAAPALAAAAAAAASPSSPPAAPLATEFEFRQVIARTDASQLARLPLLPGEQELMRDPAGGPFTPVFAYVFIAVMADFARRRAAQMALTDARGNDSSTVEDAVAANPFIGDIDEALRRDIVQTHQALLVSVFVGPYSRATFERPSARSSPAGTPFMQSPVAPGATLSARASAEGVATGSTDAASSAVAASGALVIDDARRPSLRAAAPPHDDEIVSTSSQPPAWAQLPAQLHPAPATMLVPFMTQGARFWNAPVTTHDYINDRNHFIADSLQMEARRNLVQQLHRHQQLAQQEQQRQEQQQQQQQQQQPQQGRSGSGAAAADGAPWTGGLASASYAATDVAVPATSANSLIVAAVAAQSVSPDAPAFAKPAAAAAAAEALPGLVADVVTSGPMGGHGASASDAPTPNASIAARIRSSSAGAGAGPGPGAPLSSGVARGARSGGSAVPPAVSAALLGAGAIVAPPTFIAPATPPLSALGLGPTMRQLRFSRELSLPLPPLHAAIYANNAPLCKMLLALGGTNQLLSRDAKANSVMHHAHATLRRVGVGAFLILFEKLAAISMSQPLLAQFQHGTNDEGLLPGERQEVAPSGARASLGAAAAAAAAAAATTSIALPAGGLDGAGGSYEPTASVVSTHGSAAPGDDEHTAPPHQLSTRSCSSRELPPPAAASHTRRDSTTEAQRSPPSSPHSTTADSVGPPPPPPPQGDRDSLARASSSGRRRGQSRGGSSDASVPGLLDSQAQSLPASVHGLPPPAMHGVDGAHESTSNSRAATYATDSGRLRHNTSPLPHAMDDADASAHVDEARGAYADAGIDHAGERAGIV
jgi:hypothetical protein